MDLSARLEQLLANGKDNATLRFALGSEYLRREMAELAVPHLRAAVALDPSYSAAWKLLGKAQAATGQLDDAVESYRQGIAIAVERGDAQAAREMRVFLRRIETRS